MLPHVKSQDWRVGQQWVLVLGGRDVQSAITVSEPDPARSLKSEGGCVELLLETVEAAELLVDGRLQLTFTELAATFLLWSEAEEVEVVVDESCGEEEGGGQYQWEIMLSVVF